jgi:hypothetical protein
MLPRVHSVHSRGDGSDAFDQRPDWHSWQALAEFTNQPRSQLTVGSSVGKLVEGRDVGELVEGRDVGEGNGTPDGALVVVVGEAVVVGTCVGDCEGSGVVGGGVGKCVGCCDGFKHAPQVMSQI